MQIDLLNTGVAGYWHIFSGIQSFHLRTIQQYEQNRKNINAAKAETVVKLVKALNCTVEALMEVV